MKIAIQLEDHMFALLFKLLRSTSLFRVVLLVLLVLLLSSVHAARADEFSPSPGMRWPDSFCYGQEVCEIGDFNGDGKDDIAAFVRGTKSGDPEGDVWISLSTGSSFGNAGGWHGTFCYGQEVCEIGDFNGDGRDDIAALVGNAQIGDRRDDVWVAISTGSGFGESAVWQDLFPCDAVERCMVGDFDGDGKDDLLSIQNVGNSKGTIFVASSLGSSFDTTSMWTDPNLSSRDAFCSADFLKEVCKVSDFDGDGKADIAMFIRNGRTDFPGYVLLGYSSGSPLLSEGTGFSTPIVRHNLMCIGDEVCAVGDVNGDNRSDILAFVRSTKSGEFAGDVWVALYQ
jgi:hypothetical protein